MIGTQADGDRVLDRDALLQGRYKINDPFAASSAQAPQPPAGPARFSFPVPSRQNELTLSRERSDLGPAGGACQ
jgi:hypothetical protein